MRLARVQWRRVNRVQLRRLLRIRRWWLGGCMFSFHQIDYSVIRKIVWSARVFCSPTVKDALFITRIFKDCRENEL